MSSIKFKHVFAALMLVSVLTAFVIPQRYTARVHPQVQGLLYPVAQPVRSIAGSLHGRFARVENADARPLAQVQAENDELRQDNAKLARDLEELRRLNAERETVGSIREYCTPVPVVGPDAGPRQSLQLRGSSFEGLREGMAALYGSSVAGRIERPPGLLGAQVRLLTDPGFRVEAVFGSFRRDPRTGQLRFDRLETLPALIEGIGDGAMIHRHGLTLEELDKAGVAAGHWVVLEDPDWDDRLQGRRLGKVASIAPRVDAPLFAEIRIEPPTNLSRLREVMVLTK